MAYSWSGMSDAEVMGAFREAQSKGLSAEARSAYGALYRRGIRVGGKGGAPVGPKRPRGSAGGARSGLEAALERIASLRGVQMTVGLQGPEHVADGESPGTSVMLRGAVNEFGTEDGRIPSRPFLRTSLTEHGKKWARGMAQAVPERRKGGTGAKALRVTGVVAVGDVQQMIDSYPWEPNAESTIEQKTRQGRKDRPLVDTGQMRQSIRASVDMPGRDPEVVG